MMLTRFYNQILTAVFLWCAAIGFAVANEPLKTGYAPIRNAVMPVVQIDEQPYNGFIACYSHHAEMPSYSVGDGIHVKGFIAMRGQYFGRIFHPEGYTGIDISPVNTVPSNLCQNYIPSCKNNGIECWAGGDTGGYFSWLLRVIN